MNEIDLLNAGFLKGPCGYYKPNAPLPHPKQCERPQALASDCKGEAQSPGRPRIRFTLCRVRLLDVDAKFASVKDLLDGLAYAGIIPGDREGQITLEVHQVKVAAFKDECTKIEIAFPDRAKTVQPNNNV